jgi:nucleoside-diphosphate-sugar epimerase
LKDRATELEIVSGTVTSPDDVERAVAGVEQIYHLAGMVSHKAGRRASHVRGPRRRHALVCDAAVRAGVTRIVNVSTSGVVAVSRRARTSPTRRRRAGRHRLALGLLREQAVSRRGGAARLRRQGGAGHRQPELAARGLGTIA